MYPWEDAAFQQVVTNDSHSCWSLSHKWSDRCIAKIYDVWHVISDVIYPHCLAFFAGCLFDVWYSRAKVLWTSNENRRIRKRKWHQIFLESSENYFFIAIFVNIMEICIRWCNSFFFNIVKVCFCQTEIFNIAMMVPLHPSVNSCWTHFLRTVHLHNHWNDSLYHKFKSTVLAHKCATVRSVARVGLSQNILLIHNCWTNSLQFV